MLSLLTNGCLLGPDVQGEPEETLHAPKIITELLDPSAGGTTDFRIVDCNSLTFDVTQVRDNNIEDVLFVRWFVDLDPSDPDPPPTKDWYVSPNGGAVRTSASSSRLKLKINLSDFTSVDEGDQHTVMIVIADRAFPRDVGVGYNENPEGQEAQYDSWQWAFRFSNTGRCDEEQ